MFNAYVLVRNLDSGADQLDFGEFTIRPVGARYEELRELFSSVDVNRDDWIFEKAYTVPPPGPPGSPRLTGANQRCCAVAVIAQGRPGIETVTEMQSSATCFREMEERVLADEKKGEERCILRGLTM